MSAGGDVIRIWDLKLPEKQLLAAHSQGTTCVAFHPTKPMLVSGSKDGTLVFWDPETGQEIDRVNMQAAIQSIGFSDDGDLIAVGTWSPKRGVHILQTDIPRAGPFFIEGPGRRGINGVRFSKDGQYLAMTGDGGTALFEIRRTVGLPVVFYRKAYVPVSGKHLQFDNDSKYLATVSGSLNVWELDRLSRADSPPTPRVFSANLPITWKNLEFHPTRPWAYVVSGDGIIEVRDLDSDKGEVVAKITDDRPMRSYHVAIDKSSKFLAVVTQPDAVTLFDHSAGKRLFELGEESSPIWAIAWDPKHPRLAVALSDGSVAIWDVKVITELLNENELSGDLR